MELVHTIHWSMLRRPTEEREWYLLGSNSANENHTQFLWPGGRCAVETVDEREAMSDTLQPNLESLLGWQWEQNSAINMKAYRMGIHQISVTKDMFLLRNVVIWGCCVWMYTCALEQKCKTSENEKRSEQGRAIKTMCLGQCHAAVGARKRRWQGDCASPRLAQRFSQAEKWQRITAQGAEMHRGGGLASFGLGDVEIKFYIPSCFMVPFTGEQVQSYLNLPLLLESHQNELHNQSVWWQVRSWSVAVASEDEKQGEAWRSGGAISEG